VLEFDHIFSDQQEIGSAVQSCLDRGGHPTGLFFGVTFPF
jgi:hypothetical protein